MGCLKFATAVRHPYSPLCNYFFAESNFQKQLAYLHLQNFVGLFKIVDSHIA